MIEMAAIVFFLVISMSQWMVFIVYRNKTGHHFFSERLKWHLEKMLNLVQWRDFIHFCLQYERRNLYIATMLAMIQVGNDRARLEALSSGVLDVVPTLQARLQAFSWWRLSLNGFSVVGATLIMYWDGMMSAWVVAPLIATILISLGFMVLRAMHRKINLKFLKSANEQLSWMVEKIIFHKVPPQPLSEN